MDRLLDAAFAHAPLGMAILEPDEPFRVRHANELFARVARTRGPRTIDVPFLELVPRSMDAALRLAVSRIAERGGTETVLESTLVRGRPSRHVEFTLTRIDDP